MEGDRPSPQRADIPMLRLAVLRVAHSIHHRTGQLTALWNSRTRRFEVEKGSSWSVSVVVYRGLIGKIEYFDDVDGITSWSGSSVIQQTEVLDVLLPTD